MRYIRRKAAMIILLLIFFHPDNGFCTPGYAAQTGKNCDFCHIEPAGGGALNKEGETFKADLRIRGLYKPLTQLQHLIRFFVGFLHTLTAIAWFGTILYVHILLKPAYAARGLPKGELVLGWGSIIIMAVTGTLLTIARVPSWQMLFHTRFGILLTIKICLFLVMAATAVFVTFVIGPRLKKKKTLAAIRPGDKQDLTGEELSHCDGQEGKPAYIACNGTIYDVGNSKLWAGGTHLRKHRSGADLTDILKTAPHKEDKVLRMPVIGRLIPEGENKTGKPKFFYFLAYMNLVIVFVIIFVISLWRWW